MDRTLPGQQPTHNLPADPAATPGVVGCARRTGTDTNGSDTVYTEGLADAGLSHILSCFCCCHVSVCMCDLTLP